MQERADFLIRLTTFVVGVAAIFGLAGGGLWYLLHSGSASNPPATPQVAVAGTPQVSETQQTGLKHRLEGFYLGMYKDQLAQSAGDDPSPVTFVVESGETPASIAKRLEEAGLISDAGLFVRLVSYMGVGNKIQAGIYQLRATMTMPEVATALQHGRQKEITVTIPEGLRAEEIAALLAKKDLVDANAFMGLVRSGKAAYPALADRPGGTTLEGYLFPDTYRVAAGNTDAQSMIDLLVGTFDQRFDAEMRKQAATRGLSVYQTVILASIVEREAVVAQERPLIAGVFLNRLKDGTVLNADPTVQYALGYQANENGWWKRPLLFEDLKINSPYNTYINPGLPPGPICNPGLASLKAVLSAPDTDYYYFVARGDGTHVFARTLEEHRANVQKYQGGN
ncbi:MAG: endolytic transglycosylase MltG [Chloroflexi bacterium]|nr:endolytic transglycosylase MltG [Chloroflexota bacterium]